MVKFGSHRYGTVNQWYRRTRGLPKGSGPVHHWLIQNKGPIGRYVPDVIKNQPWNLNQVASRQLHNAIEGKFPNNLNRAQRWWYGHPHWAKWAQGNLAGDIANQFRDKRNCGCT